MKICGHALKGNIYERQTNNEVVKAHDLGIIKLTQILKTSLGEILREFLLEFIEFLNTLVHLILQLNTDNRGTFNFCALQRRTERPLFGLCFSQLLKPVARSQDSKG